VEKIILCSPLYKTPLSCGHLPLAGENSVVVDSKISNNKCFKSNLKVHQKRTTSPPAKGEGPKGEGV